MLSKLLNVYKVKFSVLENLFKDYNDKNKIINIHIDLHTILSNLYKVDNYIETNWISNKNSIVISSCILNIIAHYRLFFYSRYKISTRIFLYYTNTRPRNNMEYCKEYGYKFFDKYSINNEKYKPVNVEVASNLKLVKLITEYIPDVFYIRCKNVDPVIGIGHIINTYDNKNLIITKDELLYQLINMNKTTILVPKRDESYIIDKNNIYSILLAKKSYTVTTLLPELLSVVYSFSGMKSRDVRGLTGYGYYKIAKILDIAAQKDIINNKYTHIKNILDDIYTGTNENSKLLINNFKAIDLAYQLNELTIAQKEILNNCITTKYNKKDLLSLNNTYYTNDNSIMLEELFKGTTKLDTFKW